MQHTIYHNFTLHYIRNHHHSYISSYFQKYLEYSACTHMVSPHAHILCDLSYNDCGPVYLGFSDLLFSLNVAITHTADIPGICNFGVSFHLFLSARFIHSTNAGIMSVSMKVRDQIFQIEKKKFKK